MCPRPLATHFLSSQQFPSLCRAHFSAAFRPADISSRPLPAEPVPGALRSPGWTNTSPASAVATPISPVPAWSWDPSLEATSPAGRWASADLFLHPHRVLLQEFPWKLLNIHPGAFHLREGTGELFKMQSLSPKPRPLPYPKGLLLEAGVGCRKRNRRKWGVQEHLQLGLEGREGVSLLSDFRFPLKSCPFPDALTARVVPRGLESPPPGSPWGDAPRAVVFCSRASPDSTRLLHRD